ncbi:DUF433 domain-containing protein [Halonotius roseus]|uniref:DUF433 domain-containing protein n=1 Tax=Halonotius roseus TaxID=2511997 RepID=A0A544QSS1_9EURY|nr:DUF433 domain-containing protein [Halonotius roseus]
MVTIVETPDTLNGEPRIAETRIGVLDIAELVLDSGYTPADTADQLDLEVTAVYHALVYYHDHTEQMRELRRERSETEKILSQSAIQPPTHVQQSRSTLTNTSPASS